MTDLSTESKPHKEISFFVIVGVILLATSLVFLYNFYPFYTVIIIAFFVIVFFAFYLDKLFYFLLPFVFLHGLEVNFSRLDWAKNNPYLSALNAPVIDFLVILLFLSFLVAILLRLKNLNIKKLYHLFPGFLFYFVFLCLAGISTWFAYEHLVGYSLKYLLRPMLFVYIFYVALSLSIIQTKEIFKKTLRILFFTGVAIFLFGLVAFVRSFGLDVWPRVTPFAFFGLAPFGYNHNMIGEILVAIIPIGFYFYKKEKDLLNKKIFLYSSLFMSLITLLTLSRTAWLVLLFDLILLFIIFKKEVKEFVQKYFNIIIVLVVVFLVAVFSYMVVFLGSNVVNSSNQARWENFKIATFYLQKKPWFGFGPNTYIPVFDDTAIYVTDFGESLDAHSILLKVFFEEGILGGMAMLLFLTWIIKKIWQEYYKTHEDYLLLVFFVVVSAIVFQLFSTSYFNPNMWFPLALGLSALQLSRYGEKYVE
ncbi:MAG: hypothetical protein COY69_01435 [Candidatus Magasanikbacteria bacterium CG_4_10_14_0_8_um_filter_32_14]|uniref:O-antigen ligase-related domain-containing protein n=2 Tax=Candidatus Magasanikiibacteriota TaxID=1752731 RepID=A0A2M7R9N0_9BACT|nr:MAG: hypothetical protein AUJ23_00190 [Candidatus Magasanikbacteria bacterium CG1_02_32_51]PIY93478.1 MAG: hypothetical protein COY69_01435 [Candidatus Magasanikbacteria bacterium CG_4_10_14_0_8_um_filter_32_14]